MSELLIQIIFGWPAIITSVLLSVAGVWLKKPPVLVAAGMIGIPFALYLSVGYHTPALVFSLFQFGSAFAVTRRKTLFAWLLIAPMILFAASIAFVVLTQSPGLS